MTVDTSFSDREYQIRGVHAVVDGLRPGGRGQVHAACGTGKTKIALWSAERLAAQAGVIVIAVPTIELVGQTLREWAAEHKDHIALAVTSDETISDEIADEHDTYGGVEDILEPVTTDPDVVAAWLRRPTTSTLRLIVGTHLSCHVIGEGLQKANAAADILIVDEAHRAAGRREKHAMMLHDDDVLPARARLYMTATPRIFVTAGDEESLVSMDDEKVFGPPLFRYPFSEAIADGWLDDYRLVVVGVSKAEVLAVLRNAADKTSPGKPLPSMHSAMVQAAVARAAARFDLRRIIAFCPRIADARTFANTFTSTLDAMPPLHRPRRPVHAQHISGRMNHARRRRVLDNLIEPPDDGCAVISNAKCLSEGIDVPAVDAVAFTAPKKSVVDIVQAIGRALRRDPDGNGIATIIVPILLSAEPDGAGNVEIDLDDADVGSFALLLQVVSALRAHDDRFDAAMEPGQLRHYERGQTLTNLTVVLPDGVNEPELLQHLSVQIVKTARSKWWTHFDQLVAYKEREGTTEVPSAYRDPVDGFRLGKWLSDVRYVYRQNRLAGDRAAALHELGVVLDKPSEVELWEQAFAVAVRFHKEYGHLRPKPGTVYEGFGLYAWVRTQINYYNHRDYPAERARRLESLGIRWRVKSGSWEEALPGRVKRLEEFHREHGRLPKDKQGDDPSLVWVLTRLRTAYRAGELPSEVIDTLNALGMSWNASGAKLGPEWWTGYEHLAEFYRRNGHTRVRKGETVDGFKLGAWVELTRAAAVADRLPQDRAEALARVEFPLSAWEASWEHAFSLAEKYYAENGNLNIPTSCKRDGVRLGAWIRTQRTNHQAGKLRADRAQRLTELGMDWAPRRSRNRSWSEWLDDLRQYYAQHRQLPTQWTHSRLGTKLSEMRTARLKGTLPDEIITALDSMGMRWDPTHDVWQRGIAAAERFVRTHGHLDVRPSDPADPDDPEFDLGEWLKRQRSYRQRGDLNAGKIAQLDALGMIWEWRQALWDFAYTACAAWYRRHGTLDGISRHEVRNWRGDLVDLAAWLSSQRAARGRGRLTDDQLAKLNALEIDWNPGRGRRPEPRTGASPRSTW